MKRPVRSWLPLCVLLLAATSRCSCLTATTSTGTCEGRMGDLDVTGELDPESEHHTLYASGANPELTALTLSCAKGLLKVRGKLPSIDVFKGTYPLPTDAGTPCPEPSADGGTADAGPGGCTPSGGGSDSSRVRAWEILSSQLGPALASGAVSAVLKLDQSIDGTVTMEFVDGSKVTIRFNAYHEDSLDEGIPPSSGGGGYDSDSD